MSSKNFPANLTEDQIKTLLASTKLSRDDLLKWYKEFHEYTKKNDKLNEQSFITFFEMLQHTTKNADNYYKLAFKAFDADGNGMIEFSEFLVALNLLGKGDANEKLSFMFDLYDINHDKSIDISELKVVLNAILKLNKQNLVGNQNQETKMDEIYDKLDENENGKISREEFVDILSNNIFLREILSPKI